MADITQSLPTESMLGGEDGELLAGGVDMGAKLGGLSPTEHDGVSASSHIASSMGINPHTLQVNTQASSADRKYIRPHQNKQAHGSVLADHEGLTVCRG